MNIKKNHARTALVVLLALASHVVLFGCGNKDEAPLSDDEKIQRSHQGHDAYMKGMNKGPAPTPASGAPK